MFADPLCPYRITTATIGEQAFYPARRRTFRGREDRPSASPGAVWVQALTPGFGAAAGAAVPTRVIPDVMLHGIV
jgi:hypothetical protein